MNLLRFFILIPLFTWLTACGQTKNDKDAEKKTQDTLNTWAANPSFYSDTFDVKILEQLKDSGQFVNNVKEGYWVEYSIDSSYYGQSAELLVGDSTVNYEFGISMEKWEGSYLHGNREGVWRLFISYSKKQPVIWDMRAVTAYSNGLKNGSEMYYQGYTEKGELTLLYERKYVNDVENGIGKTYYAAYPYNLEKVYIAKNGNIFLLQQYYQNGRPQYLVNDTVLKNEKARYFKSFDEDGHLKQTGSYVRDYFPQGLWTEYYLNGKIKSQTNYHDGLTEGTYKFFHDNGQLWTEQAYSKGKAMEVISNFDRQGNPKEKGTLKNGNGTIILYDENGNRTEIRAYKDGDLIK